MYIKLLNAFLLPLMEYFYTVVGTFSQIKDTSSTTAGLTNTIDIFWIWGSGVDLFSHQWGEAFHKIHCWHLHSRVPWPCCYYLSINYWYYCTCVCTCMFFIKMIFLSSFVLVCSKTPMCLYSVPCKWQIKSLELVFWLLYCSTYKVSDSFSS